MTSPIYPANPATARSESTKLGVDPKGEKIIYTNGRAVVIRDINNPSVAHAYTQHTQTATVARFSPSGFYVASGDVAGNVRVWDVTNPAENILKLGIRPITGRVNDLAWDSESKRIIVGGEGKDKFGAAFFVDSGSSCGEITGHSKPITALSVRQQRPFRAVSGSDDNTLVFHTAVPFKYDKIINTHTRFVRDVGFSPNGDLFASVGSDGKLFFYDGKTAEVKAEATGVDPTRSLMGLSWSPDSTKLATAGADGVVALWDASTAKIAQQWAVGSDVNSQQNGVVYANANTVASVSLSGELNVFDVREPSAKWRVLHGPTKAITAAALDKEQTFYTGSFDGSVKSFAVSSGECSDVSGSGHSARIVGIAPNGKDKVFTAAWDDKVATIAGNEFTSSSIPTKSQPTGVAATSNGVYVASATGLEIIPASGGSAAHIDGALTAVAAQAGPNGDLIALGTGPKKVTLATVAGGKLNTVAEFEDNKGDVLSLAFSADGALLAAGDSAGRIILIDVNAKSVLVSSRWTFHTGRVESLAFSPSGKRLASGGADESIYIWDPSKVLRNVAIKNAHPGGVSGVAWESETKVISAGADACARTWDVPESS
ncbi:WD40 repeat-like protein [Vanrija albida]|uniref:WD40 repeat-like protein n=1 Tax=Vanrija albida TaxID=181172 RepID=A0ABR3PW88_9TREE